MDLERVIKGSPWTFNNHLLILHKLQMGEDPLKASLIYSPLWVQLYNVPIGFVSENLAIQIRNFIGEFMDDSFCEVRMRGGVETKEMGWDLSLKVQSRRAQMMTSVWLREEGKE
ncbi:hypothetical protein Godav_007381 [Gossypium davidsonii]|uniref:DUF4283 domain-containing protein n=2 Tax=Gossypium TaxID=3633 RepID=A0A7J8S757_GOSDV|nr:hypothetical protein [Gossypium davidsonii]MBA0657276.1 hypothetical protein [Gossypium klotzschianum]